MKISVIIPCYNEEQTILKIIRAVQEYLKGDEYEIIIVDDASKDNSTQLIEECLRNGENLKLICHEHNSGKGAKFTRGRIWKLIYSEKYKTKKEAILRECYIKKNRKFRNVVKKSYR